jgi:hypothetical protein
VKTIAFMWIYNIIDQTLKNPKSGLWSRKNLTGFTSFVFAMAYSAFGMAAGKEVQEFVVGLFLSVTVTCLGMSSWEKKNLPNSGADQQA